MPPGPTTVYPDPSLNKYLTGVACPYCRVVAEDRCVTTGGNPYGELCHKKRKQAAARLGVDLVTHVPEPKPVPDSLQGLKLALWYIDTAGGVEKARSYMNAACAALEAVSED